MNLKKLLPFVLTVGLVGSLARSAAAVGNHQFCLNWQYSFADQGINEDYLLHQGATIYGTIDASYAAGWVYRDSQLLWSGWLDASGCTPAVTGNAGTYSVWIATTAYQSANDVEIDVLDGAPNWETYGYNWQGSLSAAPNGTTVLNPRDMGGGASAATGMAVWTHFLQLNDGRVTPGYRYTVAILDDCPSTPGSACYDSVDDLVYLGSDDQGNKAKRKFLLSHEIGHNLHHNLFGIVNKPYTQDAPDTANPDYCRCDHIPNSALRSHCIQSREHSGAGQMEGFGHFNGADAFNSPADSYAVFGYYKHVLLTSGTYPPPTSWWAYQSSPYHWKDTHCPASGSDGTELDWMTFYYEINNKTSDQFSFADIRDTYREACGGGQCSGHNVVWSTTADAVEDVFGLNSAKANYWINQGADHGVD